MVEVHKIVYNAFNFYCSPGRMSSRNFQPHPDDEPDFRPLGAEIQRLRMARGWSLLDFVEHTGLAKQSLHRLENMKSAPTLRTLYKVSIALDTEVSDLLKTIDRKPRIGS